MDEQKAEGLKPVQYLMIATAVFYGSLVLFLKLKGNFSTNPLWPFIRFGCKWSLFGWIFYAGIVYGKKLSSTVITGLQEQIQKLELEICSLKKQSGALEALVNDSKNKVKDEIKSSHQREQLLLEKLEKYERSAAEVNKLALRSFL